MAKSEKGKPSSVDNIFARMVGHFNKVQPGSAKLGKEMDSEIKGFVNSGSLSLNMVLSNRPDGGWPWGRIVEVFGRESIGKSTLGYVAMASAQKAGGMALYCDIEKTGNPDFMRMLGINLDTLGTVDIPEIEKLFTGIQHFLIDVAQTEEMKGKPVMIVVDSVTALQTDAEMESGYEYNMNVAMGKAKQLGKALKKIIPYLTKANACLYFVNQIRDNTSGYGEAYIVPGGKAIPFYSSIRLYLEGKVKIVAKDQTLENEFQEAMAEWKRLGGKKAGYEKPEKPKATKDNETTIGYEVTAYTKKNKTAPPDRRISFRIIFSQGLFDEECWLPLCVKYGIVKESGAYKELVSMPNDFGKWYATEWTNKILADKDVYEHVKEMLIQKLTIPLQFDDTNYTFDEEPVDIANIEDEYAIPTDVKSKQVTEPDDDED